MAQLEIHDAAGNVRFAEISRDKPALIGTGSNCDVVLRGQGINRVHCRILWRDGNWRIEVATDAPGVQLRGRSVMVGTISSGDQIGIGNCQLYFDDPDEPVGVAPDQMLAEAELDEEVAAAVPGRQKEKKGLLDKLEELDRPPGEERLIGSRLVQILLVAVTVVVALGLYFYHDFRTRTIQAHYDRAIKEKGKGNWVGAIDLFARFVEQYPRHKYASNARVQKALCEIEQAAIADPGQALEKAREMILKQSKEEAFPEATAELGSILKRLASNLAETARQKADRQAYEQSQGFQELLRKYLPGAGFSEDEQQQLDQVMEQARSAIKKDEELHGAIARMDQALEQNDTGQVYQAYDRLVRIYPDYADNEQVLQRRDQANALDREAAQFDSQAQQAVKEPRPSPVAATSVLLDHKPGSAPAAEGDVVFALAGGVCHALDARTGKLLWHQPVGNDCRFLPVPLGSQQPPAVLLLDTRHDDLLALEARSGKLVWRQPVGEPLLVAPLVRGGRIYQPTGAGNLVVIEAESGRIDGRLKLGSQRLATRPVADRSGKLLYVLGERYVLYVVAMGRPLKCQAVFYLGHKPETILADPLRLDRYLVLCENYAADKCRVRVLLLSADGQEIQELSPLELRGWVHYAPAVSGNIMLVATDRGAVRLYSAGPPEKAAGFKLITALPRAEAAGQPRGQVYPIMYTNRDVLVAGLKVRHFSIRVEQAELSQPQELFDGAASQPPQRSPRSGAAKALFVARRVPGSTAIKVNALDAATLKPCWETLLGDGVMSLEKEADSAGRLAVLTRSGNLFDIAADEVSAGSRLDRPARRLTLQSALTADRPTVTLADGSRIYTPAGPTRFALVRGADPAAAPSRLRLPAALAAPLVGFGNGVLVPAADGRLYWLEPASGRQLAEAFQPPLEPGKPIRWRGVAIAPDDQSILAAADSGTLYRVELRQKPVPYLALRDSTSLGSHIRSRVAAAGQAVVCVDERNVLHSLNLQTLAHIGHWQLPAPATQGPEATEADYILVVAGRDAVACVGPDGKLAWQYKLAGQTAAGPPTVHEGTVLLALTSGRVLGLDLASGQRRWQLDVDKPLASSVLVLANRMLVAGDDGSLNVLKAPSSGS